jgi:hypothetical protein
MADRKLTRLEEELLTDLFQVEEQFRAGNVETGTIRSKVMYRMASRRGKTRPAPVHGLVQADRVFKGTFTRTLNRLISRKLVQKRAVQTPNDYRGRNYQYGFAQHAKRDRDIFLTSVGRKLAAELARTVQEEETNPVVEEAITLTPTPPARPTGNKVPVEPVPFRFSPSSGVEYVYTPPKVVITQVIHRHTVRMGMGQVTYTYVRKQPSRKKSES